jgi:phosphoribosyl 1,2-cyclic phosphodiesterase
LFSSGSAFALESIEVLPFSVPHDAADPVGFVLRSNGTGFAVLTDLGCATRQVVESVRGVHALLIETNHDESLLQNDARRPWSVKQRILSRHGHLSNSAAAEVVAEVATDALRHVLLAHLSRDCNSPELAVHAVGSRLRGRPAVRIQCARVDEESPMLRLVV